MVDKLMQSLEIFERAEFVNYIDLVLKTDDDIKIKIRGQKHNAFGKKYYIFNIGLINESTQSIESSDSILSVVFETIDEFIEFLEASLSMNRRFSDINNVEIENMQEFLLGKERDNIKNFVAERGYNIYEPEYKEIEVTNFEDPAQQLMELWLKNKYSKMRIKIIEKNSFEMSGKFDNVYIYAFPISSANNNVIAIIDPTDSSAIKVIYGWGDECNNVINEMIRSACSKHYMHQSNPQIAGIFECYKERKVF